MAKPFKWVRIARRDVMFRGSPQETTYTEIQYVTDPFAFRLVHQDDGWYVKQATGDEVSYEPLRRETWARESHDEIAQSLAGAKTIAEEHWAEVADIAVPLAPLLAEDSDWRLAETGEREGFIDAHPKPRKPRKPRKPLPVEPTGVLRRGRPVLVSLTFGKPLRPDVNRPDARLLLDFQDEREVIDLVLDADAFLALLGSSVVTAVVSHVTDRSTR
jgi:hypothetical protein